MGEASSVELSVRSGVECVGISAPFNTSSRLKRYRWLLVQKYSEK